MTRINTNVASLRGLRILGDNNRKLNTSLERLSTGLKINSGKDNPSGLIASESLRSQVTVIEQSIRNSNRANNVIAATDSALSEISGLLNGIRGLVQEGLNTGALSKTELAANQSQIDNALSAVNRISANAIFAGDKLIDGSKSFTTTATAADNAKLSDTKIDSAVFAGSSSIVVDATITAAATRAQLFSDFVVGGLATSTTLEVSGAKGTDIVFLGKASSLSNIESAIDAISDTTGVIATKTAAVYGNTTIASTGLNNDLTFTDVRTTNGDNAESITQVLKVEIVQRASGNTLAVTSSSTTNELKLTLTLAANTSNVTTSTASDVKALLNSSAVSSNFVVVTQEGTGAGLVTAADAGAVAPQNVTTGATDGFLVFRSKNFGSDQFVGIKALQGTLATAVLSVGGTATERVQGTDIQARINGQSALGKGLEATIKSNSLDAALTFTSAANTLNNNAKVTITGGGTLFQIGQEVSAAGQVSFGVEAVNTARLGGASGKLFELRSGGG
ncbi:MAG: flagellin, partial [Planctomycetaceae bacterium]